MYESADAILATNSAWLIQVWETARLKMKASGATEYLLVVDEIQKIDKWSEIVKQQWDRDTREKINMEGCSVVGSSRLLIQKGLTESLAWRLRHFILDTGLFLKWKLLLAGLSNSIFISEDTRVLRL